jgi:DNA replication licensing factor MCM4
LKQSPSLTSLCRFGQQLRNSLIRDYFFYYISYDDLKTHLKSRLYPAGHPPNGPPKEWTEEDEKAFVKDLEAELEKVFTFQKVKAGEIVRRIKVAQKEVEDVVKLLDARPPARAEGAPETSQAPVGPTEDDFVMLEEDLSDIIADVHDLAKFTQLNYTGFQKIIKKHDVCCSCSLLELC